MRSRLTIMVLAAGCAMTAPARAAPPGEVDGLSWCPGSRACLEWSATPGATTYTVYRGDGTVLPALGDSATDSTFAGTWSGTTTGDMLISRPPAGGLYWYLVIASNVDGEGPAGDGAAGPRVVDAQGTSCGDLAFLG